MSVYAKEYGYFFNSNNSDRKYNASSFEEWLKPFFLPGVFNGELQVTAQSTPDMTVKVAPGHANLDGIPAFWPDTNVITIDTASGVYDRIDTIVLRRDNVNRACSIEYVKGVASISPQPVAPTRNADTYELVLAQVLVGVGVTEITGANITDTRIDSDVCGWVAATVDQIDFDQIKTQFDSWMEVSKAEFEDWFQHLQDELDDNQAAHLQNEIDELTGTIAPDRYDPDVQWTKYYYDRDGLNNLHLYEYVAGFTGPSLLGIEAMKRIAGGQLSHLADLYNPNKSPVVAKGEFVYLWKNIPEYNLSPGLYIATEDLAWNTPFTDTNVVKVQKGGLNELHDNIVTLRNSSVKLVGQTSDYDSQKKSTYILENGTRHIIALISASATSNGLFLVNCSNTGVVSAIEIYKGSNITQISTATANRFRYYVNDTVTIRLYDLDLTAGTSD